MQRIIGSSERGGVFFSLAGHVVRRRGGRGGEVNFARSRMESFAPRRHIIMGTGTTGTGGQEGTYYDSQSGQHVPIHDERKITAYLRSSIDGDDEEIIARGGG